MSRDGSAAGGVSVAPPVPAARRAVMYRVRHLGDATVDDVADALGVTVSGARQHLSALAELGLLDVAELPGEGRGRRRLTYHVTELADALFPKAYGSLTNELLGYLDDEGDGTVDRLFDRRRQHRIEQATARLDPRQPLWERVIELATILDEDGYLATAERLDDDRFLVVEHNCAIAAVAARYGQACSSEIEFIRAVLPDATVERVQHMRNGDRHCAYDVRPRSARSARSAG